MASKQDAAAEYLDHPFLAGPHQRRVQTYGDVDALLKSKSFVAAPYELTTPLIGNTLLTLRDDEHLDRRRLEQALFEKDALRDYETRLLIPIIDRMAPSAGAGALAPRPSSRRSAWSRNRT